MSLMVDSLCGKLPPCGVISLWTGIYGITIYVVKLNSNAHHLAENDTRPYIEGYILKT
jgi:hypothetical protein